MIANDTMCRNYSFPEQISEYETNCPSNEWKDFYLNEGNQTGYTIQNKDGKAVLMPHQDHNLPKEFEITSTSYCVSIG